jgi:hypothetical protein
MKSAIGRETIISWGKRSAAFLFWAFVFGLAYTQAPLYYSNQNQYFLHGLAAFRQTEGGLGYLHDDWLASTKDPTPIFSALVALTYRFLHENLFYLYYILIFGAYFTAMMGLFVALSRHKPSTLNCWCFAFVLTLIHSGLLRRLSAFLFDVDYPWYFQDGLAGQYILGPDFQPSVFGVFLILSIYLFVVDRPWWAVICSSFAAVVHTTYLLSAGILTVSYLYILIREKRGKEGVALVGLSAAIVAPVLLYNLMAFWPTSSSTFAEAQDLLVHFRIPHHCVVSRWFDWIAGVQIAWVLLAVVLVRGTRLFPIMFISVAVGLVLSLIQLATDSNGLALLFPWRVSSYLVPIATTVVLTRIIDAGASYLDSFAGWERKVLIGMLGALLILLAASGIEINALGMAYQANNGDEWLMEEHVNKNKAEGDVYLIPILLPKPPKKAGHFAVDFMSGGQRGGLIPADLQRFRLQTGAPIFVDFKAIPYKDTEVIEWYDRIQTGKRFYETPAAEFPKALRDLRSRYRITHIVTRSGWPATETKVPGLELVFGDARFRVYKIAD